MLTNQRLYSIALFSFVIGLAGCNTPQQRAYNKPAPIPPPQQQTQGQQTSGGNAPTSGQEQAQTPESQTAQQAQQTGATEPAEQAATTAGCEPMTTPDPDVQIIEVPLDEDGNPIEPVATTNQAPASADECKTAASENTPQQQKQATKSQTSQAQQSAAAASGQRAQTGEERKAAANADLDQRLAAFDELMRRAQQAAEAERQAATTGGGPQGELGGLGANQNMPEAERGAGGQSDTASGLGHTPDRSGETRPGDYQHTATGPVPADLPDGRDDDIVARQLREAASQESDPVLREKLWEEYRRYKRGL